MFKKIKRRILIYRLAKIIRKALTEEEMIDVIFETRIKKWKKENVK